MILNPSTGKPFDMRSNPLQPVPIQNPKPLEVIHSSATSQVITEAFSTARGKELSLKAGHILKRKYPSYCWMVRHIGNKNDPSSIMICLSELFQWGGTSTGMYIHPKDWELEIQFENKVMLAGGELLERANLMRRGKSNDQYADKRPDGFADIQPQKRKKVIEAKSVDHFVSLVNDHIKSLNHSEPDPDSRANI